MEIGFRFVMTLVILIVIVYFLSSCVKVVQPYEKAVYVRSGKVIRVLNPGINLVVPWVNKIIRMGIRTQTLDIPRQETVTKDDVTISVNATVFFKIIDPVKVYLEVDSYRKTVISLAQAALCSIVGLWAFDDILTTRVDINVRLMENLNASVNKYGMCVEKMEIREVSTSIHINEGESISNEVEAPLQDKDEVNDLVQSKFHNDLVTLTEMKAIKKD